MAQKTKKAVHLKDRAASEAHLLDAAKKVFSEHGFSASTTRMIAQKSGINLGLITRYFESKYGLLEAVVERDLIASKTVKLSYTPRPTLEEECLAYTEYNFTRHMAEIEYIRIIMSQFLTDRKFAKKFRDKSLLDSDAGFEARVSPHLAKLGVTDGIEIKRFVSRIESNTMTTILFGMIIAGYSEEVALDEVKIFVQDYCRMFIHFHTPKGP